MIENRYRIEREIFRGRKAIRKGASKAGPVPVRDTVPESSERDGVSPLEENKSSDGDHDLTLSPEPGRSVLEGGDGGRGHSWPGDIDDDDDETPFEYGRHDGKLRIKVVRPEGNATTKPRKPTNRSPSSRRRRWTAHHLDGDDSEATTTSNNNLKEDGPVSQDGSTPPKSPQQDNGIFHTPHLPGSGFIQRIRQQSFVNFTNPFPNGIVRRMSRRNLNDAIEEEEWSSDSSDLDDELNVDEDGHFYEPISVDHGPDERRGLVTPSG